MRLAAAGVLPPMLDAVFLTHLHSDHITDLGDVITTRWVMSPGPRPLVIHGPQDTRGRRGHARPSPPTSATDSTTMPTSPRALRSRWSRSQRATSHARLRHGQRGGNQSPTGRADRRLPRRSRRALRGARRRRRAVRRARRAVPRRGCLRPDGHPGGPGPPGAERSAAGHPRLPLHGRAGRPHGHHGGRGNTGAHPLRARHGPRPGGRSGAHWRPPTSAGPSCSATT